MIQTIRVHKFERALSPNEEELDQLLLPLMFAFAIDLLILSHVEKLLDFVIFLR